MGNDYVARQRSKKRRSVEADLDPAADQDKRRRKKRPAVRRICRGACYSEPKLTPDDTTWPSEEAELAADSSNTRCQHPSLPKGKEDIDKAERKQGEKLRQKTGKKRQKLSTAINLVATTHGANVTTRRPDSMSADLLQQSMQQFPASMHDAMVEAGHSEPMPVQARCWPICLEGGDLAATAEPGSGKTLAYLLPLAPLLHTYLQTHSTTTGPIALVLVPTRELAYQVAAQCRHLKKASSLTASVITGGVEKKLQVQSLSNAPNIVIGTPGRLLELASKEILYFDDVRHVVLDEADKMLSMGLQPQLEALRQLLLPSTHIPGPVAAPPGHRPQVMMFSATTTAEAEAAATQWLQQPTVVSIGASAANISKTVVQAVHVCAEHKKPQKLLKHLQQIKEQSAGLRNPPRTLIFANRIKTVRFLHQLVVEAGLKTAMLHGERSQAERNELQFLPALVSLGCDIIMASSKPAQPKAVLAAMPAHSATFKDAMQAFRSGKVQVLVATDVAARGLHIRGLPYVVNYDFPSNLEQYIHRAGRTGRLATHGHCYSFFTRNLAALAGPLLQLLQGHGQAVDPNLVQLAEAYETAVSMMHEGAEDASDQGEAQNGSEPWQEAAVLGTEIEEPDSSTKKNQHERQQDKPEPELCAMKGKHQKRRAVPGRLRKKLASARAKGSS